MMNSLLFLCHAHLYASAMSLVRGFCRDSLYLFVAVLCGFVPFPKLSGGTSAAAVAGARTPWKRFITQSHATQITIIRLMPFCRFVKEKRPFLVDSFHIWILYPYSSHRNPPPCSFFCYSHKSTIVRPHRTPSPSKRRAGS